MLLLQTLAMVTSTHALLWTLPPSRYDIYDIYSYGKVAEAPTAPSPLRWTATPDSYELHVRLPALEPASVTASLAADGTKIEVTGERKIDGCTCRPNLVQEISLPHRPRPEDVDVSFEKDILSLKMARHAKTDEPTPLAINVVREEASMQTQVADMDKGTADLAPQATDKQGAGQPRTRPLTFVPHASANEGPAPGTSAPSLAEQEVALADKFRSAALAALATTRGETSSKEAAATLAEHASASSEDAASASASVGAKHADVP